MERFPIQTFQPTFEEFLDFERYIKFIESQGAHKAGICKVIPPPEYKTMMKATSYYNPSLMGDVIIPKTERKVVNGKSGVYKIIGWTNVPSMTVKQFKAKTGLSQYKTPRNSGEHILEKKFWEQIPNGECFYGAGVHHTFMDEKCKLWNLNSLNSILNRNKEKISGIHSPYMYFGSWKSTFCWHTEDMELYSINYLHFGEPKSWYSIPPDHARQFESVASKLFPAEHEHCQQFLRHKFTLISPKVLESYGIPVNRVTQRGGEFIITFPDGYHAGFNLGFNCAEAVNFATERWPSFGRKSKPCVCKDFASVQMNMKVFAPPKTEILKQSTLANQSRRQRLEKNIKEEKENVTKRTSSIRTRSLTTAAPYSFRARQNTVLS